MGREVAKINKQGRCIICTGIVRAISSMHFMNAVNSQTLDGGQVRSRLHIGADTSSIVPRRLRVGAVVAVAFKSHPAFRAAAFHCKYNDMISLLIIAIC